VLYRPIVKKFKQEQIRVTNLKQEVEKSRLVMFKENFLNIEKEFIPEEEVFFVIENLSRFGGSKGIVFSSINQGKIKQLRNSVYQILPIEVDMLGEYQEIGEFLGGVNSFSKGVFSLKSFRFYGFSVDNSNELRMKALLNLYIKG
jgi:Tfp pilus assembly protein PilO